MKNLLLTVLVAGLVVLAWHPGNGVRAAAERAPMRAVVVDSLDAAADQVPVRIDAASIEDDTLIVDVGYPGGCKVHDFKLLVADAGAVLAHRAYGDPCETSVAETLRFDLATLASSFPDGDELVITLGDDTLRYAF